MRHRIRRLYVRGLALCHVVALLSYAAQADLLVGPNGLQPIGLALPRAAAEIGVARWWLAPTLLWAWPSIDGVNALLAAGVALSFALVLGLPWEGPALLALWAIYLSLCTVGGAFFAFQWDSLLVEATFCALFVARWGRERAPPRWAWAAQHWLVFRLVFLAGWVKVSSGDPHWADLTALDYHFWTQPLPNPLSRWAHAWPEVVHRAGVAFTLLVELVLPLLIPFGRWPRLVAAAGIAALMGLLALTGNYGFFQLLTVVLCLPLVDDGFLPARWRVDVPPEPDRRRGLAPFALVQALLGALWVAGWQNLPQPAQAVLAAAEPLRTANPYGLFAVMTTDRVEVVFEGQWEDAPGEWRELALRYKPGPVDRVPPMIAPHLPRVDWRLWFAGLSDCAHHPWVYALLQRTVDGPGPVDDAYAPGTFDDGRPIAIRAVAYRYTFAPFGSGRVWDRERLGLYCPEIVERR